jgi:hypothetical protein
MLVFAIGMPGRFSEWCEVTTARLLRHSAGSAELIRADTLEEITHNLLRANASHGAVALRHPGGRIRRALVVAGRPFIIIRNDPWASLADLVAGRGVPIAAATQQVASSCASVVSFSEAPGVLVLRAEREGKDRLSMAAAVARYLRFDVSDGEIAEIVRRLGGEGSGILDPSEIAAWWDGLDPAERGIASGAFGPYLRGSAGGGLGPITWAPELFFVGDRSGACAAGGVDITGRARCLLRGPHIMLPPATWSLSLAVDVSPEAAEHVFIVEATSGTVVGRTVIRPTGAGVIETDFTLVLDDLPDQPIDLVLYTERPAFGGHLTLLQVTLTPQPSAPIETGEDCSPTIAR